MRMLITPPCRTGVRTGPLYVYLGHNLRLWNSRVPSDFDSMKRVGCDVKTPAFWCEGRDHPSESCLEIQPWRRALAC